MTGRRIAGRPSGAPPWRRQVAAQIGGPPIGDGVVLAFTIPPGRWVDLDTLTETTLRGMVDAGTLPARLTGLDALVATKAYGPDTGVVVTGRPARSLQRPAPGPVHLERAAEFIPRRGDRAAKRAWREALGDAWHDREPLTGAVWADVSVGVAGSLLTPLEVILDALEPVLGRDPRGRSWQEFFPNDDRIRWLRVQRVAEPPLVLRLGPLTDTF